jgi:cobalamin synthase
LLIFSPLQLASGFILSLLVSLWCGFKAKHYLGGITGDILGATAFLTELAFLLGILLMI